MTAAYVLMTAMPPTKGHLNLMRFATHLPVDEVKVLVCTQPSEPFAIERWQAVHDAAQSLNVAHRPFSVAPVRVLHLHRTLPQDPASAGFWDTWRAIMADRGAKPGDYYVTSELYGATLAKHMQGHFMPYDPGRELAPIKATRIRDKMVANFADIMPTFQRHLRTTITIFGAESTGKTTLSRELAGMVGGHWLFEWARPYLETVGPTITIPAMVDIWQGQLAAQRHMDGFIDKPFVIQDTDLYSTIGYWEQPPWASELGPVPEGLIADAKATQSDLYIILKSNIPFEQDTIRYGVDKRESPDEFWIGIADKYGLNYIVLDESDFMMRLSKSMWAARLEGEKKAAMITYDRGEF